MGRREKKRRFGVRVEEPPPVGRRDGNGRIFTKGKKGKKEVVGLK